MKANAGAFIPVLKTGVFPRKTHKGYLVASMKYSQMNTIDMVSSSQ